MRKHITALVGLWLSAACMGCKQQPSVSSDSGETVPIVAQDTQTIDLHASAKRAETQLRASRNAKSIEELLNLNDEQIDIAVASMMLDQYLSSEVPVDQILAQLDRLAARVVKRKPLAATNLEIIETMNEILFVEEGFQSEGSVLEFELTQQSEVLGARRLSDVLSRKKGNCVGLSTLYLAIGQRLGMPIYWGHEPKHAFVYLIDDGESLRIEPTERGEVTPAQTNPALADTSYLRPMTIREAVGSLANDRAVDALCREMPELAIALSTLAVKLNPANPSAWQNRCVGHLDQDQPKQAIDDCTRRIQIYDHGTSTRSNRAIAHMLRQDYTSAIQDLKVVVERSPRIAQHKVNLGIAYKKNQQLEHALVQFDLAIASNTTDKDTYSFRGETLYELGRHASAVADLTHYLEAYPQDSDVLVLRAQAHAGIGDSDSAISDYGKALGLEQNVQTQAGIMVSRALELIKLGKFLAAEADLNRALELVPTSDEATQSLAMLRMTQGRFRDVTMLCRDCADVVLLRIVTRAYIELGEHDHAVEICSQAIKQAPESVELLILRADAYLQKQQTEWMIQTSFKNAMTDLERAYQLDAASVEQHKDRILELFSAAGILNPEWQYDQLKILGGA